MKFTTTDLHVAAFMLEQELSMVDYQKSGPGKLRFTFEASEERWKALNISYFNSDFHRVRKSIDDLKSLLYS